TGVQTCALPISVRTVGKRSRDVLAGGLVQTVASTRAQQYRHAGGERTTNDSIHVHLSCNGLGWKSSGLGAEAILSTPQTSARTCRTKWVMQITHLGNYRC